MHLQKTVIILGIIVCFLSFASAKKTIVCYIAAWSIGRPNEGRFSVLDADLDHCTHVVYAFMSLDAGTSKITSVDNYIDTNVNGIGENQLIRLRQLKFDNPDVKVLVSIGGWNEKGQKFSDVAKDSAKRRIFIDSVKEFLRKYNLDGLDICWQFPGLRGGAPQDTQNFVTLLRELKAAFEPNSWVLTVHIIAKRYVIDKYNVKAVSDIVDYINFVAVEYSGPWERKTGIMAPLTSKNELNVKFHVDYIIKKGANRNKILLGLPTYGHAYIVKEHPTENDYLGLFSDQTFSNPWTLESGIIGYNEFCVELNRTEGWKKIWDNDSKTPVAFNDNKFVSLDDKRSLLLKSDLVKSKALGGVAFWSLDMDDFQGLCYEGKYPLISAVANNINK